MSFDAAGYWERRYRQGRTSGAGSEGEAAIAKAQHVDALLEREQIRSVIDWGCGDGEVLSHVQSRVPYLGIDISPTVIKRLRRRFADFPERRFTIAHKVTTEQAELALSLDVMFHLTTDEDYRLYLAHLFSSATRFVLVRSSDHDGGETGRHVRWRHWTPDVAAGWSLIEKPDDPAQIGWYLYAR